MNIVRDDKMLMEKEDHKIEGSSLLIDPWGIKQTKGGCVVINLANNGNIARCQLGRSLALGEIRSDQGAASR
jgi:hypothetical protein